MLHLSEPQIIERGPYNVVGIYCPYEGNNEGPGWSGAHQAFTRRKDKITNRTDDMTLGFLYRPHTDHPEISEDVRACFIGTEVTDLDHVPEGMSTTRFSGGKYAIVECRGETQQEVTMGVGEAVQMLEAWVVEQGYVEGDACFVCSPVQGVTPPFIEYVYIKMNEQG